jgi:hypothetical protein
MPMWRRKQIFFGPAAVMLALITLSGPGRAPAEDDKSFTGEAVKLAEQSVTSGEGELIISLEVPPGYEVMPDVPALATVTSDDERVVALRGGAGATCKQPKFPLRVPIKAQLGATLVRVDLVLYYCKKGAGGLCLTKQARLTLPVKVDKAAATNELQASYRLPAF